MDKPRQKSHLDYVALNYLEDFVKAVILDEKCLSVRGGMDHDTPEEVIYDALLDVSFPLERREKILSALEYFYPNISCYVCPQLYVSTIVLSDKVKNAIISVCRIVDVASPPELFEWTQSIFKTALENRSQGSDELVMAGLTRASMGYADKDKNLDLWLIATEDDRIASYAVNALRKMGLQDRLLTEIIPKIEKHVREDGWPFDIEGLRLLTLGVELYARIKEERTKLVQVLALKIADMQDKE